MRKWVGSDSVLTQDGVSNRAQQHIIEYLQVENQVLQEKLGRKRILLNDDQRRRLAAKGKVVGRRLVWWKHSIGVAAG